MSNKNNKLSVFISLILRHKPEVVGIELDGDGYACVDKLIEGVVKSGRAIDFKVLKEIVDSDTKGRYSFNDDCTKIRANQGHSVKVDVGLKALKPPTYLYHGTYRRVVGSIVEEGIKKMSRLYVHLSADMEVALQVGGRRGDCVILKVDTYSMYQDGYKFYLSENGVWLTDYVPKQYVEVYN